MEMHVHHKRLIAGSSSNHANYKTNVVHNYLSRSTAEKKMLHTITIRLISTMFPLKIYKILRQTLLLT